MINNEMLAGLNAAIPPVESIRAQLPVGLFSTWTLSVHEQLKLTEGRFSRMCQVLMERPESFRFSNVPGLPFLFDDTNNQDSE